VVNQVRDFVMDFRPNLPRSEAARRIHEFVTATAPVLAASEAFAGDGGVAIATDEAAEGLEKFVVLKLHKVLFRHSLADVREDEHAERCLQQASSSLEELPLEMHAQLGAAAAELRKVDQYRAPRDKVVVLLNAYRIVEGAVGDYRRAVVAGHAASESPGGAGEEERLLTRMLEAVVVQAAPPNFFSNLEFSRYFRHPSRRTAEERRCIPAFALALTRVTGGAAAASTADLPQWLTDAGVTLRFESRSADDLLVGEVDELLDEYHRLLQALRDLGAEPEEEEEAKCN